MIDEDIRRYRLQMIVHSVIYYTYNCNIISDEEWSKRAKKLVELQNKYPDIANKVIYADEFKDFDGSTGFQFANHPWGKLKAKQLLQYEYGQKFVPEGLITKYLKTYASMFKRSQKWTHCLLPTTK